MTERRLAKLKTDPVKYFNQASKQQRQRNLTGKKYFLPPRKK